MALKDLPKNEKPREKLIRYGVESLSNVELITIIIGSGTKNNSAMDVAYSLLKEKGLLSLSHIPYEEYMKIKGISHAKALMLTSMFELFHRLSSLERENEEVIINSEYIYQMYKDRFSGVEQEILGIIILDKNKHIISEQVIYKGTKDYIKTSLLDIIKPLMIKRGTYFYLYHNHPSGSVLPSDSDVAFTESVIFEAKKYGFKLLDHIIIGEEGYFSFASGDPTII